ncbi:MAG: sigma-70 family RNA polymerase sigma factor [Ignavibacteriae bacterium]|nr:sigma-70 family RNA polymerase sigma factor [Ignavibacteriota bacterium]
MDEFLEEIKKNIENGNYNQWVVYADKLLNLKGMKNQLDPVELINEIITKTACGIRKYKPDININAFIKETAKSEVSNYCKKKKEYIISNYTINEEEDYDENILDNYTGECYKEPFTDTEIEDFINKAIIILKDDEEASIVFLEMQITVKRSELAENLGLTVIEVTNILKRIKRKLKHLQ